MSIISQLKKQKVKNCIGGIGIGNIFLFIDEMIISLEQLKESIKKLLQGLP